MMENSDAISLLQRWPYIGPVRVDSVILPIIIQYAGFVVSLPAPTQYINH